MGVPIKDFMGIVLKTENPNFAESFPALGPKPGIRNPKP